MKYQGYITIIGTVRDNKVFLDVILWTLGNIPQSFFCNNIIPLSFTEWITMKE